MTGQKSQSRWHTLLVMFWTQQIIGLRTMSCATSYNNPQSGPISGEWGSLPHLTLTSATSYQESQSGKTSSRMIYLVGLGNGRPSSTPTVPGLQMNIARSFGLFFLVCGMQMSPKLMNLGRKRLS
ncbi:hypothetical protein B0H19DRAFT_1133331 [Mycena capillaripes]|nr:hypothetical protein B0H19DRAFT_1133331 [Mycena capillaripes]